MKKFENNMDGYEEMAKFILNSFGNIEQFKIKDSANISVLFLAGAPGSGKTEFLETIFKDFHESFIIIDIDKYRTLFKGYNGSNSDVYQNGSVKVADKILKFCFKKDLNFVFDGTFRNYNKIKQNFGQCKKYNRFSLITLIFQEPRLSFYYTFLRKIEKKRNVPIDVFVDGFYSSIENVFKAIGNFDNTELMIAHKVYTPLNTGKGIFKIDNKTDNIYKFCEKYRLFYKKGKFLYREKLILDINIYNDILIKEIVGNGTTLGKLNIWFYNIISKYF
ncbi:MAG: zeta toxin family protein [Candidatus Gracilibacteria bacterium]|nr:zeta toxin family protein [Candidatus Gracilibacteria bacterium]MDQ7022534.1 zeta toxin family protein [Candidatus Gracilibacteria bacterium]